jgi:endonuclease YncB( thermonuclease family)
MLFGVRPPNSGDRCLAASGLNLGTPPPCLQKAQDTLIARLARNPSVSCRVPAPGTASAAAICLDADGVDLGGFLVAEGLALADPAQSYDYVGAESIARSQHRGLWRFH